MFSPRSSMSARFSVFPSSFHAPPTMYSPERVKKHISNSAWLQGSVELLLLEQTRLLQLWHKSTKHVHTLKYVKLRVFFMTFWCRFSSCLVGEEKSTTTIVIKRLFDINIYETLTEEVELVHLWFSSNSNPWIRNTWFIPGGILTLWQSLHCRIKII